MSATPSPAEPAAECCPVCAGMVASVAASQDYLANAAEVLEDALRLHRRVQEAAARFAELPHGGCGSGPGPPDSWPPVPDEPHLTARERQVLAEVSAGCTNRQVARLLGISEKTVKNHLSAIYEKIGVSDRTQAALYAVRVGLARA